MITAEIGVTPLFSTQYHRQTGGNVVRFSSTVILRRYHHVPKQQHDLESFAARLSFANNVKVYLPMKLPDGASRHIGRDLDV